MLSKLLKIQTKRGVLLEILLTTLERTIAFVSFVEY